MALRTKRLVVVSSLIALVACSFSGPAMAGFAPKAERIPVISGSGNSSHQNAGSGDGGAGSKAGKACVVGSVVGGGLAILLGGKLKDVVGAAALGCGVFAVFAKLTENDRAKLSERSDQLVNENGPRNETWIAPESKETVLLKVSDAQPADGQVPVELDDGVAKPATGMIVAGTTYIVASDRLVFRADPSDKSDRNLLGFFNKGEQVQVLGFSADRQWLLLGDQGVLVGYAKANDNGTATANPLQPIIPVVQAPPRGNGRGTHPATAPAPSKVVHAKAKLYHRSGHKIDTSQSSERLAANKPPKKVTVAARTTCKAIVAESGGKTINKSGCRTPSGLYAIA